MKDVLKALKKKLQNRNSRVQMLALSVSLLFLHEQHQLVAAGGIQAFGPGVSCTAFLLVGRPGSWTGLLRLALDAAAGNGLLLLALACGPPACCFLALTNLAEGLVPRESACYMKSN